MKFTRELSTTLAVRSVRTEGILINDQLWQEAVALTPEEVIGVFQGPPLTDLTIEHFETVLAGNPELVLLGGGSENPLPPKNLMFAFARRGIGLEVMSTDAAARTFNVLAGEGRRVSAVLYPV